MTQSATTVYFDFGGVISRPQDEGLRAEIRRLIAPNGKTEEFFWKCYYAHRHAYDADEVSYEDYWKEVCMDLDVPFSRDLFERVKDVDDRSWSVINQETLDWASKIREKGIKTGILSNMPTRFFQKALKPAPWLRGFDHLVISGEIGLVKPNREIFRYACSLAGSAPAETVFFDDTEANVEAAREFGLRSYLFTGIKTLPAELFDLYGLPRI